MFQDRLCDMRVVVDAELVRRDQQQRASLVDRFVLLQFRDRRIRLGAADR
jgi:hypothetical protein